MVPHVDPRGKAFGAGPGENDGLYGLLILYLFYRGHDLGHGLDIENVQRGSVDGNPADTILAF